MAKTKCAWKCLVKRSGCAQRRTIHLLHTSTPFSLPFLKCIHSSFVALQSIIRKDITKLKRPEFRFSFGPVQFKTHVLVNIWSFCKKCYKMINYICGSSVGAFDVRHMLRVETWSCNSKCYSGVMSESLSQWTLLNSNLGLSLETLRGVQVPLDGLQSSILLFICFYCQNPLKSLIFKRE